MKTQNKYFEDINDTFDDIATHHKRHVQHIPAHLKGLTQQEIQFILSKKKYAS